MGGVQIFPNTTDPVERRLLNVVEEMAIASGVPVPPVYLLGQEQGINAFAAGYSPSDAVMGVTRGCAEQLTREELQGVLAHEFSHILNGDMRIGIRVMGVLYGVLLMGLVGQLIFRSLGYAGMVRSRRDSGQGNSMMVLLLIGLALIVLGFIGTFLGNLIKAAISRQRERLADASGVQFTRNPAGLAGALKRIGALEAGSQLQAPNAAQASHIFFAEGVWKSMAGLWSSHPPLEERIRELEPNWDGTYPAPGSAARIIAGELAHPYSTVAEVAETFGRDDSASTHTANFATELPLHVVDRAVQHVGNPTMAHVQYAADLRPLIPDTILAAAARSLRRASHRVKHVVESRQFDPHDTTAILKRTGHCRCRIDGGQAFAVDGQLGCTRSFAGGRPIAARAQVDVANPVRPIHFRVQDTLSGRRAIGLVRVGLGADRDSPPSTAFRKLASSARHDPAADQTRGRLCGCLIRRRLRRKLGRGSCQRVRVRCFIAARLESQPANA